MHLQSQQKKKRLKESRRPRRKQQRQEALTPNRKQYEVECIVDAKKKSGKREFLVKWKGYGPKQNTWEPASNLNCPKLLSAFLKKEGKTV
uniref:Chromobox protein-like protein 1 n=1 Tax=Triatoma infestans TaxID=30076 RepID=A0A171AR68_TRIIF